MTSYPVNFEYDKHSGVMHDGFANSADDAKAILSTLLTVANGTPTEAPTPYLTSCEAGPRGTKEQIETWWADDIAAGWVTPLRVNSGYVAQVEHWVCR